MGLFHKGSKGEPVKRGEGTTIFSTVRSQSLKYTVLYLLVDTVGEESKAFFCPERGPIEILFFVLLCF